MTLKLLNRTAGGGGGMTDEYGTYLTLTRLLGGSGVVEGMAVTAQTSPNMTVLVGPGTCLVPTGTYPTSYAYHCFNDTVGGASVTIGTANVSNPRIDYIVAYVNTSVTPNNTFANNPNSMFLLADVQGTAGASPVVPTTSQIYTTIGSSSYPYIVLAQISVGTGVTQILNSNITDLRAFAYAPTAGGNGWQSLPAGTTLTYSANNGNKEYVLSTSSNLTGTLSPGMKLALTRGTSPPTQCMSFASVSSQYATKATPSGLSGLTSTVTMEYWGYFASYGAMALFTNLDTTGANGFYMDLTASGQLDAGYVNASSSYTTTANQSIPLNQFMHLAATINASTKTILLYINDIQVSTTNNAGSPTSIGTFTGYNLTLGAKIISGTASNFLNGYMSEVRLWSSVQSQAAIAANMGISISPTATNLVGYWQGNGSWSDQTSNGNGLTANGGASDTQASNPYNTIECATIRAVSSTTITVYTGDAGTIPNESLTLPQYSIAKEPYGLPEVLNSKVLGKVYWCSNMTTTATATGTQLSGATMTMTIPSVGKQVVMKYYCPDTVPTAGTGIIDGYWGSTQVGRAQGWNSSIGGALYLQTPPISVSSGAQTFSIDVFQTAGGTYALGASTGNPAWFTVEEA